jgi:hypothetical protein
MESVRAVGADALEVTSLLRSAAIAEGAEAEFDQRLAEALAKMDSAVARAKEIRRAALEAGLTDVARQADSLEQQLASARGKLKQGGKPVLN